MVPQMIVFNTEMLLRLLHRSDNDIPAFSVFFSFYTTALNHMVVISIIIHFISFTSFNRTQYLSDRIESRLNLCLLPSLFCNRRPNFIEIKMERWREMNHNFVK